MLDEFMVSFLFLFGSFASGFGVGVTVEWNEFPCAYFTSLGI
jgi:hypothetical protein